MGRVGLLILSWCLAMAALARPAAAGDFPKNIAFLAKLPVVIAGECLFDSNGPGTEHFGPCEVRAATDAGGKHLFYIMAVEHGRLDGVQSFTLSARPVEPSRLLRQGTTVVMRGTCRGRELGPEAPTSCDIAVYPVGGLDTRIFLRLLRFPSAVRTKFYEVYPGPVTLGERASVLPLERAPAREGGGDDGLALGRIAPR